MEISSRHSSIYLRALIAALLGVLVTLPQVIDLLATEGLAVSAFSDWDEPLYLRWTEQLGTIELSQLLRLELESARTTLNPIFFPNLFCNSPQLFLDMLIGKIVVGAKISPLWLGVLLDFSCFATAFFLFAHFFRKFLNGEPEALAVSFVVLSAPWLFSAFTYFDQQGDPSSRVFSYVLHPYIIPPIFRAVYTQVSVVLFAVWLLSLYAACRPSHQLVPTKQVATVAVLSSALLYCYAFAWFSAMTLTVAVVALIYCRRAQVAEAALGFALKFGGPALVCSLPGILLALNSPNLELLNLLPPMRNFFYLSVSALGISALGLWALFRTRLSEQTAFLIALLTASALAELILMNLQPLIGTLLIGYHFPLFYLHPLRTGVGLLLLLRVVRSARFRRGIISLLFAVGGLSLLQAVHYSFAIRPQNKVVAELATAIRQLVPVDSPILAVMHLSQPSADECRMPSQLVIGPQLAALTGRSLVPKATGGVLQERAARIELLYGWVFHDAGGALFSCPPRSPSLPGDIVGDVRTFQDSRWYLLQRQVDKIAPGYGLCQALADFRFDYVLLQRRQQLSVASRLQPFVEEIWADSTNGYMLLRFKREEALAGLCAADVSA